MQLFSITIGMQIEWISHWLYFLVPEDIYILYFNSCSCKIFYVTLSKWVEYMNNKMKAARIEKGLTQEQLASRVKATRQTIGLIEKGKYNPSLQLCMSIAKELDKTLDELFWEGF